MPGNVEDFNLGTSGVELTHKVSQLMKTPVAADGKRYILAPITTTDEVIVDIPELKNSLPPGVKAISLTTLLSGKIDGFTLGGGGGNAQSLMVAEKFPHVEQLKLKKEKRYKGMWAKTDRLNNTKVEELNNKIHAAYTTP